ncbi:MAG: hypothetical protein EBX49_01010 [Synechococcaceae bacterium WB8_1B_136]|nr:hypothetical protein [Synechococcaceae bacterium WB8_1B_136]
MTRFTILADDRAELISGGWGSTRISLFKATKAETNLGQGNQVSNLGLGLLAGYGNAQSLQGNSAGILTLVG